MNGVSSKPGAVHILRRREDQDEGGQVAHTRQVKAAVTLGLRQISGRARGSLV